MLKTSKLNLLIFQTHYEISILTSPAVNLTKLFRHQFTISSFCKLDVFIAIQRILVMFIKWSNLQKSASKYMPKKFGAICFFEDDT